MGFPVESNIFDLGSGEQEYFTRFPIQVAVLFSPMDEDFREAFRDIFLHLDQFTGDDVAFFAVLDPPDEWLEMARNRVWWQAYRQRIGRLGFSLDDRTLVYEMARRYGVSWDELPALIISTNLWTAEFVAAPTSAAHVEAQLRVLTDLAREWERPTMGQIIQQLKDELGTETRYHHSDEELRVRFFQMYAVLNAFDPHSGSVDERIFQRYLDQELRTLYSGQGPLQRARSAPRPERDLPWPENDLFDRVATEVTGRLVPHATVAKRAYENLADDRDLRLAEQLDEESLVMIETSLIVGDMLESLHANRWPGLLPLHFDHRREARRHPGRGLELDFTPGAQGVWKSLEKEANLSIIQAARLARGIEMPTYYTLYMDGFDKTRAKVTTDNGPPRNLNVRDRNNNQKHEFFTLGVAYYVTQTMLRETEMETVIEQHLQGPFPDEVMRKWKQVFTIRNRASHIQPLSRAEYEETLETVLSTNFLSPLMRLKQALQT